jgi:plasmid stability protein
MTNLTISLDEDIIRNARVRAIREGTSVSAKLREFLAKYAQNDDAEALEAQRKAGEAFLQMARARRIAPVEHSPEPASGKSLPSRRSRDDASDRYPTWPRKNPSKRTRQAK